MQQYLRRRQRLLHALRSDGCVAEMSEAINGLHASYPSPVGRVMVNRVRVAKAHSCRKLLLRSHVRVAKVNKTLSRLVALHQVHYIICIN